MTDLLLYERAVPYVRSIVEKRAPTDDSVKLLREMEAAAEAKILASTRVDFGGMKCVIHVLLDAASDQTVYRAVFSLNGFQMHTEHRADRDEDEAAAFGAVRKGIAEKIADHAMAAWPRVPKWSVSR